MALPDSEMALRAAESEKIRNPQTFLEVSATKRPPGAPLIRQGNYLPASFCFMAASVSALALPSDFRPAAVWNFIKARLVAGP